jgi:predicted DNA-binding transcriptional regulator AlpA
MALLKIKQVAEKYGLHPKTISKWKNGYMPPPPFIGEGKQTRIEESEWDAWYKLKERSFNHKK